MAHGSDSSDHRLSKTELKERIQELRKRAMRIRSGQDSSIKGEGRITAELLSIERKIDMLVHRNIEGRRALASVLRRYEVTVRQGANPKTAIIKLLEPNRTYAAVSRRANVLAYADSEDMSATALKQLLLRKGFTVIESRYRKKARDSDDSDRVSR